MTWTDAEKRRLLADALRILNRGDRGWYEIRPGNQRTDVDQLAAQAEELCRQTRAIQERDRRAGRRQPPRRAALHAAGEGSLTTIHIRGELTATSLQAFRRDLAQAGSDDLNVIIDSWGGLAAIGTEMYVRLKRWPGRTVAQVRFAGSAATLPMCACRHVIVDDNSVVVTHSPTFWGCRSGCELRELREGAEKLEVTRNTLAGVYAEKTGHDITYWLTSLAIELRWQGRGILDIGFADEFQPVAPSPSPRRDRAGAFWRAVVRGGFEKEPVAQLHMRALRFISGESPSSEFIADRAACWRRWEQQKHEAACQRARVAPLARGGG